MSTERLKLINERIEHIDKQLIQNQKSLKEINSNTFSTDIMLRCGFALLVSFLINFAIYYPYDAESRDIQAVEPIKDGFTYFAKAVNFQDKDTLFIYYEPDWYYWLYENTHEEPTRLNRLSKTCADTLRIVGKIFSPNYNIKKHFNKNEDTYYEPLPTNRLSNENEY